ncbi:hypothetical protein KC329_g105 [Hortaea werneckii]|nr:hypothetical protein KC329_g105 [Hortaea werneckii]
MECLNGLAGSLASSIIWISTRYSVEHSGQRRAGRHQSHPRTMKFGCGDGTCESAHLQRSIISPSRQWAHTENLGRFSRRRNDPLGDNSHDCLSCVIRVRGRVLVLTKGQLKRGLLTKSAFRLSFPGFRRR